MQRRIESAAPDFLLRRRPKNFFRLASSDAFGADGDEQLQQRGRAGVGFYRNGQRVGAPAYRKIAETVDLECGLKLLGCPHGSAASASRLIAVSRSSGLSAYRQNARVRKRRAM